MPMFLSTRDVAELCGTDTWRVRRLFEDGTLKEPGRFVGKRAISKELLPEILDALRERGWLHGRKADRVGLVKHETAPVPEQPHVSQHAPGSTAHTSVDAG